MEVSERTKPNRLKIKETIMNWWVPKAFDSISESNQFFKKINITINKTQNLYAVTVKSIKRKTLFKNRQTGGGGLVLQPNQRDLTRVIVLEHRFMQDWAVPFSGACICKPLQLRPWGKQHGMSKYLVEQRAGERMTESHLMLAIRRKWWRAAFLLAAASLQPAVCKSRVCKTEPAPRQGEISHPLPSSAAPFPAEAVSSGVCCGLEHRGSWVVLIVLITWRELRRLSALCPVWRLLRWQGQPSVSGRAWRAGRDGRPRWGLPGAHHHLCHWEGVMTGH